jgi:hypothetical protein
VNNCVGKGNSKTFLLFIVLSEIDFLFAGVMSVLFAVNDIDGYGLYGDPFSFD